MRTSDKMVPIEALHDVRRQLAHGALMEDLTLPDFLDRRKTARPFRPIPPKPTKETTNHGRDARPSRDDADAARCDGLRAHVADAGHPCEVPLLLHGQA